MQHLTYSFHPSNKGTPIQQNKVHRVIKEWQNFANVTFDYKPEGNTIIRIAFKPDEGSWSFVGREITSIAADQPTMNLGWISTESADPSPTDKGVMLHEFGHTLGLMHEHQSPARGGTLTLNEKGTHLRSPQSCLVSDLRSIAVIESYTVSQGWTEEEVREQIIDVYNLKDVGNYSRLDLSSIMM